MEFPSIHPTKKVSIELPSSPNASSKIKAMGALIKTKIEGEAKTVEQIFKEFDTDNSGGIDKEEFNAGCKMLGFDMTAQEVEEIW
jgi:Ca2+-binding EF-hand superfamily protein